MQAAKELETRFNAALAKIYTTAQNADTNAEIARISNELATLEAWKVEQEQVLEKATADIASSQKEASDAAGVKSELDAKVTELTTSLEASTKACEVAQNQLSELAAQKLAAEVALQQAQESIAAAPADAAGTSEITEKLAAAEKKAIDLQAELDAALAEKAAAPATGDNSALEKELSALKAQREVDLAEVNVIIEKLIPLVEGK